MTKEEIKTMQELLKKFKRDSESCKHRNDTCCNNLLNEGIICNIHTCPGMEE